MNTYRTGDDDETTTTTASTATAVVASSAPSLIVPYLLIRTELCGKTLKQWLEGHQRRKRKRLFSFFEQVSIRQSKDIHPEYTVGEPTALGGIQTHGTLCSRQVLYYQRSS